MDKPQTADMLPYIVIGQWVDTAKLNPYSPYQSFINQPRQHPYGIDAWQDYKDGEWRIYPSKEAAEADGAMYATGGGVYA